MSFDRNIFLHFFLRSSYVVVFCNLRISNMVERVQLTIRDWIGTRSSFCFLFFPFFSNKKIYANLFNVQVRVNFFHPVQSGYRKNASLVPGSEDSRAMNYLLVGLLILFWWISKSSPRPQGISHGVIGEGKVLYTGNFSKNFVGYATYS